MSRFDIPAFGQVTGSYLEDTIFRGSAKALLWHTFTLGAIGTLCWASVRMWQDEQAKKGIKPTKEKLPTGGLWGALQPALAMNPVRPYEEREALMLLHWRLKAVEKKEEVLEREKKEHERRMHHLLGVDVETMCKRTVQRHTERDRLKKERIKIESEIKKLKSRKVK